ncbi:FlgK family flagellar hook-associated protein [Candidatus Marinarcus aquaticus]|uniref:Flagellar hook-associated protein 1 n=1 Tax=Candidatus Marinarcus aquaticus TaxID=2044504 RepID=A0A4Q0XT73_9BACT|nr:flagellar basal body rod C-terminal domain-containing protein [Candidatus Marinarcus aquaticus]RXJ56375.1 hypothetical protein CRV04_08135 [Candidatus Marinarcus aquaticus]
MLNTLDVAYSGLSISKRAADAANNNVANQMNKEYVRRSTSISEAAHIDNRATGRGVDIGETIRNANDFIYQNFLGESTSMNYYKEVSDALSTIESFFKETENSGFSKDLDAFFQAIEDLKSNPSNTTFQAELKTRGQIVVDDLKGLYQHLNTQEAELRSELKSDARNINRIVHDIANINEHLATTLVPQNTLLDKRDALEKELAQLVDIDVSKQNGEYILKIGNVTAVRNDIAREFSYGEEHIAQLDRYTKEDGSGNVISSFDGIMGNANDKVIYELNDTTSIELTYGQAVYDANGNQLDLNGDNIIDAADVVDDTNIVRALVLTINNDPEMSQMITAYNGNYTKDSDGNITPDPDNTVDRYLVIESKKEGAEGKFKGDLIYLTDSDANNQYEVSTYNKDETRSVVGSSESYISSYEQKVEIAGGPVKAKIENLDTTSPNNYIQMFKDKLDMFAATLSDMTEKYVLNQDGSYIYGETAINNSGEEYNNKQSMKLFNGNSIATLSFNKSTVAYLDQQDYDYLSSLQYKSDILFSSKGQVSTTQTYEDLTSDGTNGTSFSKYFQGFQVDIAFTKSNTDYKFDTQQIVTQSLENSYNQLVKVDEDVEMLNIMKFQAAYEANAKIARVLQDMIQTTLNMVNK